jgi:hypothetical protein
VLLLSIARQHQRHTTRSTRGNRGGEVDVGVLEVDVGVEAEEQELRRLWWMS